MQSKLFGATLTNWKSVTGSMSLVVMGVAGAVFSWLNPESPHAIPLDQCAEMIALGWAAFGIAHKVQRAMLD